MKSGSLAFAEISADESLIRGVAVITEGEARGHGLQVDLKTLQDVEACANEFSNGVKVKIDHGSGVIDIVGSLRNFRIERPYLRADLHLLKTHPKVSQIVEMATALPDNFGLSVSFTGPTEEIEGQEFARCSELFSVDLVDEPAANPTGLFSTQTKDKVMPEAIVSEKDDSRWNQFLELAKKMLFQDAPPEDEEEEETEAEEGEEDEKEDEVAAEEPKPDPKDEELKSLKDKLGVLTSAVLALTEQFEATKNETVKELEEKEESVEKRANKMAADKLRSVGVKETQMSKKAVGVQVQTNPLEEFKNLKGTEKTTFYRKNKKEILARAQHENRQRK